MTSSTVTLICSIINLIALVIMIRANISIRKSIKTLRQNHESMSMIDEAEIKRKTVGPTPETINLIKSCQVHDVNYKQQSLPGTTTVMNYNNSNKHSDEVYCIMPGPTELPIQSVPTSLSLPHNNVNIVSTKEEPVKQVTAEQVKQVTQQPVQQVVQTTKAPVVKARTIQEQRQIITNFLELKEETLKPDKVLVKELGTTIGTLEKYATTEQMTEWARLRQICFSKPRFTTSSINNTPTSLEQNANKRIMEA